LLEADLEEIQGAIDNKNSIAEVRAGVGDA